MSKHEFRTLKGAIVACGVLGAGLLAGTGTALAYNGFLTTFTDLYPASRTSQAGCMTCHGATTKTLNPYGKDLCVVTGGIVPNDLVPYLRMLEGMDSDLDPTASINLAEISAHAQPGWTASTSIFNAEDCSASGGTMAPPNGVPLPYDPPLGGDPVAVPGGPYTGLVHVPVTFDGTGSYDSDGGSIVSYTWDFGDGASGSGAIAAHTYAVAGTYAVTLTTVDDDQRTSANATTAVITEGTLLDLDIDAFTVTKTTQVGKPVSIKLAVVNRNGAVGQAFATVVGMMGDTEIYRWRQNVFDDPGKAATTFTFPPFTALAKGTIGWAAFIADGNADDDTVSAVTTVK